MTTTAPDTNPLRRSRETGDMAGPADKRFEDVEHSTAMVPADPEELARLEAVRATGLLDAAPTPAFDAITDLLSAACDVPIVLVTLVDEHRQFFPSHHGLPVSETPRDQAFCAHAITQPDRLMVVSDSHADPRFATNPLVTGPPFIRFYAGHPLSAPSGHPLGTLCLIDRRPRELSPENERLIRHAARQVEELIAHATARHELAGRHAELVEQHAELEQAIEERTRFLAVAKHKLKTPLAVITGWSSTLSSMTELTDSEREDGLAAIERSAAELRAQIDDLLDEARLHLRGQSVHIEPIELASFVAEVVDHRRPAKATHPVTLDIPDNIVVDADRDALEHVVAHLLDNAVKYSPDGGPISFGARYSGANIVIEVADRGIGISDDEPDLFEPFSRGATATRTARGTGLGLHIVRLLTTAMHGSVAASERDGGGSVFVVELPAARGPIS